MKKLRLMAIVTLLMLLLAACQNESAPAVVVPGSTQAGATTVAGKATVVGRVLSQQTGAPLANTPVRLAEVYREGDQGAYVLDGARSPGAVTGGDGGFVISNIEAKEYVVVIGDPYGKNVVVPDPSGKARVWMAAADQVLDIGSLRVALDK